MPEIRMVLARNIRARLALLHDSVTAVAARAHCSRRTLHAILRTEVSAGIERVSALAIALDSTASDLLHTDDLHSITSRAEIHGEPTESIRLVLARNLAYWRARRSFPNLETLASVAAISRSSLYMIIHARCDTSIDQLARLGDALDVTPARLVNERGASRSSTGSTPAR